MILFKGNISMHKLFLLFIAFCSASFAQAQNPAEENEVEIKGIKIGMSKSDIDALLGDSNSPKSFSIAGINSKTPPAIFNRFIDGKLSQFSFYFSAINFSLMQSAVKEKYPDLACETSEVKNRMGATFEQVRCKINYKSGELLLSKYSLDLNTSGLVMTSEEEREKFRLEMQKKKKDI